MSLLKEWKHSKTDKPDLVLGLEAMENIDHDDATNAHDAHDVHVDGEEKMWMMLDTQERKKRKEEVTEKEHDDKSEALDGSKSVVECVRSDDLTVLTKILRTDHNHDDETLQELITAALVAAREGFPDALKILLDEGSDSIDIIDNQHDDAGGVDADVTDENGWTLLRTSSWSGQDQCVKTLLEAGAKVCCTIYIQ